VHPLQAILGDIPAFLDRLFAELDRYDLDVDSLELDHLCYRVNSIEHYEQKKSELTRHARLLTEALINNRPIASFELFEPITYKQRKISVIELPAPKHGTTFYEGLEHVEFVITEPFDQFMARYPSLSFETSGMEKRYNPEIQLQFGDIAVKFHHCSLRDVIRAEQSGSFHND